MDPASDPAVRPTFGVMAFLYVFLWVCVVCIPRVALVCRHKSATYNGSVVAGTNVIYPLYAIPMFSARCCSVLSLLTKNLPHLKKYHYLWYLYHV